MTKEEQSKYAEGFDAASLVGAEAFAPEESKLLLTIHEKLDEIMAGQKLLNEKIDKLQRELRNEPSKPSWAT